MSILKKETKDTGFTSALEVKKSKNFRVVGKSKHTTEFGKTKFNVTADTPVVLVGSVYGRMSTLLGQKITSEFDLLRVVKAGLPSSAAARNLVVNLGLIGPATTVRRRIQEQKPFTTDESERLVRFARITSMAEELFGQSEAAHTWLSSPSSYLPGSDPISPIELSTTDSGARVVEAMILQTAHGIF